MSGLRRKTAYVLLRVYKASFSLVFYAAGARCQHKPTCSEYGAECVARHGWWPGGWMAIARFIRCRPGGSFGYDPAPETKPDVPAWLPWRYGDWTSGGRHFPNQTIENPPEA
ncbi:MAG: membrane protein insertion efficiency factor YidD [Hyphomonas oceanitis]|uniref:membrane protein insertion efficiency factor YidD n=1 Tax=Hyphomonas oceanitis TaxID=81033 RepID=UPI0030037C57